MPGPTLLLTRDESLAARVGRIAAAAGVDLVVEPSPTRSLGGWAAATAVLVGADAAGATCEVMPPRREQVHLLCREPAPDALFRHAVALGAASVVELPDAEPWLAELLADLGDGSARIATTLAVVGGSGGVGASAFAAALAVRAAGTRSEAALVDLDPWGPGLLRVLGWESGGVTWQDLAESRGRLGARALRTSLPRRDGLGVLGWSEGAGPRDLPTSALLREVVSAARRGHSWVVLDVPRRCAELLPVLDCDHWHLVARTGVAAVAAASQVVAALRAHGADARLVTRGRRGGPESEAAARVLGVPLVATAAHHRRLDEHLDLGLGPVHSRRAPLAVAADEVLAAVRSDPSSVGRPPLRTRG